MSKARKEDVIAELTAKLTEVCAMSEPGYAVRKARWVAPNESLWTPLGKIELTAHYQSAGGWTVTHNDIRYWDSFDIKSYSEGRCDPGDVDATTAYLVQFGASALRAPAAEVPAAKEAGNA